MILSAVECAYGQAWSGILDTSRAIDWTQAGVVGGIPSGSWTQCGTTIASGASAATIQAAINACTSNHYVLLASGTFNLTTGINMKTGVVLRGSGANSTSVNFSSGVPCGGLGTDVCFIDSSGYYYGSSAVAPGGTNSATWSGTNATNGVYTQGATSIRLTSVGASAIANGQYIYLDQVNDNPVNASSVTSGLLICDNTSATDGCSLESGSPGRCSTGPGTNPCGGGGVHRNLVQIVKVVSGCATPCTGAGPFDITITPGIYGKKWASGFTPGAWWSSTNGIQNSGIENMTLDHTGSGTSVTYGVYGNNAFNCWMSGVRSIKANRAHFTFNPAAHITVQNSYFFGTQSTFATSYGVESFISSDNLVINNIFQQVTAPIIMGPGLGNVFAYNFGIHDTFGTPTWMQQAFAWHHDAAALYNLSEGNITSGYWSDVFHGTGGLNTVYRSYAVGWESGKTQETVPFQAFSYNRFENVIASVLGCNNNTAAYPGNCGTPYHTAYITHNGVGQAGSIYDLNAGNNETSTLVLADPYVTTSIMRWGNYDVVHASNQWVTGEVPSGLSDGYSNAVPTSLCTSTIACPASFWTNVRPSFWSGVFPGIGPEITGGNVPGVGGHVYLNPAATCYLNTMLGPADGTGSVLAFNPTTCYAGAPPTPPAPPTGVTTTPH